MSPPVPEDGVVELLGPSVEDGDFREVLAARAETGVFGGVRPPEAEGDFVCVALLAVKGLLGELGGIHGFRFVAFTQCFSTLSPSVNTTTQHLNNLVGATESWLQFVALPRISPTVVLQDLVPNRVHGRGVL